MSHNKCMRLKLKKTRAFPAKNKPILRKKPTPDAKEEYRNPTSGRTNKEAEILREEAMKFLMIAGLKKGGLKQLKKMGYDGYEDSVFIKKNGLGRNYIWDLQMRDDFKEKFFKMVTSYMAKDLIYYIRVVLHGKDSAKAVQMMFPDAVGRALATRSIVGSGSLDDEKFRDDFFGYGKKEEK